MKVLYQCIYHFILALLHGALYLFIYYSAGIITGEELRIETLLSSKFGHKRFLYNEYRFNKISASCNKQSSDVLLGKYPIELAC